VALRGDRFGGEGAVAAALTINVKKGPRPCRQPTGTWPLQMCQAVGGSRGNNEITQGKRLLADVVP